MVSAFVNNSKSETFLRILWTQTQEIMQNNILCFDYQHFQYYT